MSDFSESMKKLESLKRQLSNSFELTEEAPNKDQRFNSETSLKIHSKSFDIPVLNNYYPGDLMNIPQLDMLEIIKERLWQKRGNVEGAQHTLYTVLYGALRGLAPFMPFITEEIYQQLPLAKKQKCIMVEEWP